MSDSDPAGQTDPAAALRRAQAQLALAERVAGLGCWRLELASGKVEWSPALYAVLGLDRDRMSLDGGAWILGQARPEDRARIESEIARAIAEKRPFRCRASTAAIAGSTASLAIETFGEVECDGDGKPVALIGVCREATDADSDGLQAKNAESLHRVMADQASDIMMLYDASGKVLFASDALRRVLGRTPQEIGEYNFLSLVHPDDREEAAKIGFNPPPGETLTATFRLQHKDGHYVWLESTSRGLYDDAGNLQNIVGMARDISERHAREAEAKAARDEAVAANMAKSTFLANMSHELRTPLNAIIGFAEIMRKQMFGPLGTEQYCDYARLIHESGQLLLELISDVLDMAKIEAGKLELHVERVELALLVEDCQRLVEERAKQNEIALVADLDETVPALDADRRALKQILLNLLTNAVKFTLPGGCVCVRTRAAAGGLALAVQDDGVGIPPEDLPRLGKPFEQARTDATLAAGGAGLGLALVRALAEKHGGTFRIESEEGFGTTVTVWLPLRQEEHARSAA